MKTKLLASLILFTFCAKLNAQWIQTNGPYGGQTTAIASNATDLFATFSYGKISHSIDNGITWTDVSNGLSSDPIQ
ncbi:MAG TPA: hypothetical protein PLZ98_06975, partial [Chitinophagaceae bacterium]|nr:hypothetical protein [Chitinophagaceae bacterium]